MMKLTGVLCLFILGSVPNLFAQTATGGDAVSFSTQDDWTISASYRPADAGQKTLILLHDLAKDRNSFAVFSTELARNGNGFLALDLRGHGKSQNKGAAYSFAKEGVDNEYNKMVRDVDGAVSFLKSKGVAEESMVIMGAGLGANVAAKSMGFWPGISGLVLITPTSNNRDVLSIPAMRLYKGDVFIGAAADDKKTFLEASVLRNVAFLTTGEGRVTFATAYDKSSHALLDAYLTPVLLQWLATPAKPEVKPDLMILVEEPTIPSALGTAIAPSATEDALFPSVLN